MNVADYGIWKKDCYILTKWKFVFGCKVEIEG